MKEQYNTYLGLDGMLKFLSANNKSVENKKVLLTLTVEIRGDKSINLEQIGTKVTPTKCSSSKEPCLGALAFDLSFDRSSSVF